MSKELLLEITNWKLEAKLEDIHRYFYPTQATDLIANGSRCYVIGRKGTGKTAIAEHLHQEVGYYRFSQKLTFKNFPFNELYNLQNTKFRAPNQYITLWKYLIYSSVAKMMSRNENIDSTLRSKLANIYSDDLEQSLPRTITKWTSSNFEFKILATGVSTGLARSTNKNDVPWIDKVEILEKMIIDQIDDSFYFIIFDELDEDYKDTIEHERREQYTSLLTSLFKAVQDVKSIFRASHFKLLPIIFLRDDIYSVMQDPDKNKWRDLSIDLDWNVEKIKKLIAFRISRAIDPNGDILSFPEAWTKVFTEQLVKYGLKQRKRIPAFDFITRSSHIRPRDYVRYMQICADMALEQDFDTVGPTITAQADKAFSNYMRSEIEDEIHGFIPEISQILDTIAHLGKQTFTYRDFLSVYKTEVRRGYLPDRNVEFILRVLFHFSVIGNAPRRKSIQVFRYLNKEARINLDEPFCVHRGLFKAFQIV